jgi:hypothetical protein
VGNADRPHNIDALCRSAPVSLPITSNIAARPIKMGNIVSPWRYDAAGITVTVHSIHAPLSQFTA